MRLTRSAAVAAGLTGLLCGAAPAALASPAPAAATTAVSSPAASSPAVASAVVVRGAIGQRYAALGGRAGFLGAPLANEAPTYPRPGAFQNFQGGSIFWSVATGAWETHGAIREKWFSQRAENGPLGFPRSNETASRTRPGSVSVFERGAIGWSVATGAHTLQGAILADWAEQGAQGGALGWPTTDEIAVTTATPGSGAVRQEFQGGTAYWSVISGVGTTRGAIRTRWNQLGGPGSALGLPVGNELRLANGNIAQVFEGGVMNWNVTLGAVVVRVIGYASLNTTAGEVVIEDLTGQPFTYTGDADAFGSVSITDPAQIVTPLTREEFVTAVTAVGTRTVVVVTHDPASGRNVFTIVRDIPTSAGSAPSGLGRYLQRIK